MRQQNVSYDMSCKFYRGQSSRLPLFFKKKKTFSFLKCQKSFYFLKISLRLWIKKSIQSKKHSHFFLSKRNMGRKQKNKTKCFFSTLGRQSLIGLAAWMNPHSIILNILRSRKIKWFAYPHAREYQRSEILTRLLYQFFIITQPLRIENVVASQNLNFP